jgi:hypothetical protein
MATAQGGSGGDADRSVTIRLTMTLIAIVVCFVLLVCPSMLVQFVRFAIDGAGANGGGAQSTTTHEVPFQTALLITDLMQAVKFSSNFLLYCIVSRSFRRTFGQLVRIQRCRQRCNREASMLAASAAGADHRVDMSLMMQQRQSSQPRHNAPADAAAN